MSEQPYGFRFNVTSDKTKRELRDQMKNWGGDGEQEGVYVVVDDCGACIVAAFSFTHHAEIFAQALGEPCYVIDQTGARID